MLGSRNEQLKLIEEQQLQLQRYEKRLRDVIAAYKSLLKEKQALEESLKALNDTGPSETGSAGRHELDTSAASSSSQDVKAASGETGPFQQQKVATLVKSLATLSDEKSRIEASLKAEKNALKRERDGLSEQLRQARQEWSVAGAEFREQIDELRNKLWVQQMDREKEQNNHAVMLRELQTLVAIERSAKEQLESQLDELRKNLTKKGPTQQKCDEYQSKVQMLSDELQVVRDRLKAAEEKALQPQPLLLKLQQQLIDMKAQHGLTIAQEQHRANDAEERLRHIAKTSEERVAGLEAKLSELSEVVGGYDRVRHQDQQAILRLKERVSQLDLENVALTRAASNKNSEDNDVQDDEYANLDVQSLARKILRMKRLLHLANERSEKPINVDDFLQENGLSVEVHQVGCCKELQQLKDEFERYKLRAQSMLKNRNVDDCHDKEVEGWKTQAIELNQRVRTLTKELEEQDTLHRQALRESEETALHVKLDGARELAKLEAEYRAKVAELENQMQKQRERTLSLLAEKDDDVRLLKMSLGIFGPGGSRVAVSHDEEDEEEGSGEPNDLGERFPLPEELLAVHSDGHLLHYIQEIARKDKEISALRNGKHSLESEVRELKLSIATKEAVHSEEIRRLNDEIHRLDRNRSREGANLEYLKNVVYNYVISSDTNHRRHMLNAIATLLEFSPQELQAVRQTNSSWWWQQASKKPDAASNS